MDTEAVQGDIAPMEPQTANGNRHIWIMVLCCLIPVAALGAIFLLKIPVSQVVTVSLILLCPLSHVLMMALGGHQHGSSTATPDRLSAETDIARPTGEKGAACH
jgi:hypothetical protein